MDDQQLEKLAGLIKANKPQPINWLAIIGLMMSILMPGAVFWATVNSDMRVLNTQIENMIERFISLEQRINERERSTFTHADALSLKQNIELQFNVINNEILALKDKANHNNIKINELDKAINGGKK